MGMAGQYILEPHEQFPFKEEFFGSKFITVPQRGENVANDYNPKVQARKLYQISNEQIEKHRELQRNRNFEDLKPPSLPVDDPEFASYTEIEDEFVPYMSQTPEQPVAVEPEDEVTVKLKKLKNLFEKQLITQEEYESKKADILSHL